ncbi:MAG: hypothetical protein N4A72_19585 [Bacteroidales bacterium]|jgi:3-oxoacyl-[acyl-carrier-protein] synthase-1|nr:hypothetical protein [Bacteroidales bacterium]
MSYVYLESDNIISSLGYTTSENINKLSKAEGGVTLLDNKEFFAEKFPVSMINRDTLFEKIEEANLSDEYTLLEKIIILSVNDALKNSVADIKSEKTAIVLSTTKGNIDLLDKNISDKYPKERVLLWSLAETIAKHFNNPNRPVVVSNACISGVMAINIGADLINTKQFDNVVIIGTDIVSKFVVSGFQSFKSVSQEPCKPFDADRVGLTLGEACGTLILTNKPSDNNNIVYAGGATANDANHISGPSRTGEGSFIAINKALKESGLKPNEIDYISAHGTATPYNDEMESIAISRVEMEHVPVNSLKGYWGHTLGAAGLIETIAMAHTMRNNILFKTLGYSTHGVSKNINVITETENREVKNALKLASGFGGCNAALILKKLDK